MKKTLLNKFKKEQIKTQREILEERVKYYQEKQKVDGNYYLMCCQDNLAKLNNIHYKNFNIKNFLATYENIDNRPPFISLEYGLKLEELIKDEDHILAVQKFTNLDQEQSIDEIFKGGLKFGSNYKTRENKCLTYLNSAIFSVVTLKYDYPNIIRGVLVNIPKNDNIVIYEERDGYNYINPNYILGYYYYENDYIKFISKEEYLSNIDNNALKRTIKKD